MALDEYDDKPREMIRYLKYYGWHFNNKMCTWAILLIKPSGKLILIMTKEKVDEILKKEGITIENNILYDATFVINMGMIKYFGTAITDQNKLAKFTKAYLDNNYPEVAFSRFYIDTVKRGIPIDWDEMV